MTSLVWGCDCAEGKAEAMLVTAIDEVAWVLNLRGADVDYNPVFVSYLLVTPGETTLYVDPQKVRLSRCKLGGICASQLPSPSFLSPATGVIGNQQGHTNQ